MKWIGTSVWHIEFSGNTLLNFQLKRKTYFSSLPNEAPNEHWSRRSNCPWFLEGDVVCREGVTEEDNNTYVGYNNF